MTSATNLCNWTLITAQLQLIFNMSCQTPWMGRVLLPWQEMKWTNGGYFPEYIKTYFHAFAWRNTFRQVRNIFSNAIVLNCHKYLIERDKPSTVWLDCCKCYWWEHAPPGTISKRRDRPHFTWSWTLCLRGIYWPLQRLCFAFYHHLFCHY